MSERKSVRWCTPEGSPVACKEKIAVLEDNYKEIKALLQDAIDDAVLMGCSEKTFKDTYADLLNGLKSQYPEIKGNKDIGDEKDN